MLEKAPEAFRKLQTENFPFHKTSLGWNLQEVWHG